MSFPAFQIEIVTQGWLGDQKPEYDPAQHDLCSHGDIRLVIGGRVIAPGDEGEYGISESALALLRTVESDHSPERPVAERLVPHGCGLILMLSCPIGIDWSVSHVGARVRLHDVVRYDSVDETQTLRFPGLAVELERDEYCREVVAFAEQAKQLFVGVEKVFEDGLFEDDFDRQQYEEFWAEYDQRLTRLSR